MGNYMPQQIRSTQKNGFVHTNVSGLENTNYSPIYGYRDLSVTTLEEAIKSVLAYIPDLDTSVNKAKKDCYKGNAELTVDESAAIYLYTMANPFHSSLNDKLRAENQDELKPWLPFLKLFITALGKLPSLKSTVWRGVASGIKDDFFENYEQTWWTVNSCSKDINVIQNYINMNDVKGTVFTIDTMYGKDIAKYSVFPQEKEVLLMPGTRVYLKSAPFPITVELVIACFEE
jgi:hypothetical protein